MKSCVAVLTRGYTTIPEYDCLIKRNEHIAAHLTDKSIDVLIFHEGNILPTHQSHIMRQTPNLKIRFIDVVERSGGSAFNPEKAMIPDETRYAFPLGYRHMCSFWFVDFWKIVTEYDYLLRIDEDCYVEFPLDSIFDKLQNTALVFGRTYIDDAFVTVGLNDFTREFLNRNRPDKTFAARLPEGPYTNVFGVALHRLRNNAALKQYVDEIDRSNMIYKRRWGDLPLWGEAIHYIIGADNVVVDGALRYYHASHGMHVN